MAHAVKKRKPDGFTLQWRETPQLSFQKLFQIDERYFRVSGETAMIIRALLELLGDTVFGAAIPLSPPHAIDSAASRQRYLPTERFARCRRIMRRFLPNLDHDFLQHVVGIGFFVNDISDDRFEAGPVTLEEFTERILFASCNRLHERLIGCARHRAVIKTRFNRAEGNNIETE